MHKNIIGGLAAALLLIWLTQVLHTRSVILGVIFPIVGAVLALVWFVWTAQERIADRAQPQVLDLESLEMLKKVMREKKERQAAAAARTAAAPAANRAPAATPTLAKQPGPAATTPSGAAAPRPTPRPRD